MRLDDFTTDFPRLPAASPVWHSAVSAEEFRELCEQVSHCGGKLVALWSSDETESGAGYAVHAALVAAPGIGRFVRRARFGEQLTVERIVT